MRKILLYLLIAGCDGDVVGPIGPDAGCPTGQTQPGRHWPVQTLPTAQDAGASCPTLEYGVVRCADLAPECVTLAPQGQESGLHCIPGYEGDPSVPCMCIGAQTPDSWCLR